MNGVPQICTGQLVKSGTRPLAERGSRIPMEAEGLNAAVAHLQRLDGPSVSWQAKMKENCQTSLRFIL